MALENNSKNARVAGKDRSMSVLAFRRLLIAAKVFAVVTWSNGTSCNLSVGGSEGRVRVFLLVRNCEIARGVS